MLSVETTSNTEEGAADLEENINTIITTIEKDNSDISSIETSSEYGDLLASDDKCKTVSNEINNETEADVALETIANYLNNSLEESTFDKHTLNMANVAIESICENVNFKSSKNAFSLETYAINPKAAISAALEDIKERAAALWMSVRNKISELAQYLGEKMNYFKRNLSKMKYNVKLLEQKLSKIESNAEAKAKILKPQNWFIDLMYSDQGIPDGLAGVAGAVEQLLNDHRKIAVTSIEKYTRWLVSNYKEAEVDSKVYSTLKVYKNEFIIPGSTEFNRSIGLKKPLGDCVFYRSKELPGNKAFYTEVKPKDYTGISGIGTISTVNFRIDHYDPQSFKMRMLNLQRISSMSVASWLLSTGIYIGLTGSMSVPVGIAAVGVTLYTLYNSAKVKDTGVRVKIEKDMVFKTLTLTEVRNVISDLKSSIVSLEKWYSDIFENNWKQAELDKIIKNVTGINRVEVNNSSSFRALKRYCMALLNLMNSTTVGIHAYAFKTYNSMINYVDKSLRQY